MMKSVTVTVVSAIQFATQIRLVLGAAQAVKSVMEKGLVPIVEMEKLTFGRRATERVAAAVRTVTQLFKITSTARMVTATAAVASVEYLLQSLTFIQRRMRKEKLFEQATASMWSGCWRMKSILLQTSSVLRRTRK
jgi:hypothetical protein